MESFLCSFSCEPFQPKTSLQLLRGEKKIDEKDLFLKTVFFFAGLEILFKDSVLALIVVLKMFSEVLILTIFFGTIVILISSLLFGDTKGH